jgi:uncharacterized protein YbaA (DUF1428 family)
MSPAPAVPYAQTSPVGAAAMNAASASCGITRQCPSATAAARKTRVGCASMSLNRRAILPGLTHCDIFLAPELVTTVLPFSDGKSGATSWDEQVRQAEGGADMDKTDKYVDGFVLPLPTRNIDAYKQFSAKAGAIWKEHGALEYVECVADDVQPGKVTSFPQAVKLEADEVVVFSWIVYKSRADRDRINAAVMSDPRLKMDPQTMPFDGKRMFWGGFKVLLAM